MRGRLRRSAEMRESHWSMRETLGFFGPFFELVAKQSGKPAVLVLDDIQTMCVCIAFSLSSQLTCDLAADWFICTVGCSLRWLRTQLRCWAGPRSVFRMARSTLCCFRRLTCGLRSTRVRDVCSHHPCIQRIAFVCLRDAVSGVANQLTTIHFPLPDVAAFKSHVKVGQLVHSI